MTSNPHDEITPSEAVVSDTPDDGAVGSIAGIPDRWFIGAIGVMTAVAAGTFYVEARTEPYHIDELRQVRPYAGNLESLIDASFSQEQPPLDVLAGALTQRILGVGDIVQRSHSIVAGLVALVLLSALLWRAGLRVGIPVAIGVLAIAPAFVSYTAYARPYALPLALMLAFAVATEYWLDDGRVVGAIALTLCALLLPLARVFEPPAFLVLSSASVLWFRRSRPEWGRRVWWVVGSAATALLAVELPVYRRLQSRLTAYQGESGVSLSDQLNRIIDDSLPRLGGVFVHGWLAVLVVVLVLARRDVRALLARLWWVWPLLGTALAFAAVFHLRTQPTQPFYDRYGYFWLPVFAIGAGALMQSLVDGWRTRSVHDWVAAGTLLALFISFGNALTSDFRSTTQGDYRSLGAEIEARLPTSTVVVFDTITIPLGSYRPGFAGYGRYTSTERQVLKAELLIRQPQVVRPDAQFALATNGPVLDIAGWSAIPTSATMTLYVADSPRQGTREMADDMITFGRAVDARGGSVLRLGAVSLLVDAGDVERACQELALLVDDDDTLISSVRVALGDSPIVDVLDDCQAGSLLDS